MAYLLDADAFIRAKRLHYGFDFCPAFWEWLVAAHANGSVFSVEKVGTELLAGDDELAKWAKERGDGFFRPPDERAVLALARVSAWASDQAYEARAIRTFMQAADYWLVAQALADGHTVVTHEVPSASRRNIKIPDAGVGLGVRCLTPYEMLRIERARFVLGPSR